MPHTKLNYSRLTEKQLYINSGILRDVVDHSVPFLNKVIVQEVNMGEKIALGTHVCVDWECAWDGDVLCTLAQNYEITKEELGQFDKIQSERELLIAILDFMQHGSGGELLPEDPAIVEYFARKFPYRTTLGGTAARAGIVLSKLGYSSVLQMCADNSTIRELLPELVHGVCAHDNSSDRIYPHVSITYPKNAHISINDIEFVTSRENRVLISRDIDSTNMMVDENFGQYLSDAKVFLLGCFCEVVDRAVLEDCVSKSKKFLADMPENSIVLFEDGCYHNHEMRAYVHAQLREHIEVLSMNEDELQQYVGHRINLRNPGQVLLTIQQVYDAIQVPTLFVHSSLWALSYGENPFRYKTALESGIAMASTRFWFGDEFGWEEYNRVKALEPQEEGARFAEQIQKLSEKVCCVPCKDLGFVTSPTVVGLGDSFAGGLLMELSEL